MDTLEHTITHKLEISGEHLDREDIRGIVEGALDKECGPYWALSRVHDWLAEQT